MTLKYKGRYVQYIFVHIYTFICKYHTILYKGLEHPQISVSWGGGEVSWNQSLADTEGPLHCLLVKQNIQNNHKD